MHCRKKDCLEALCCEQIVRCGLPEDLIQIQANNSEIYICDEQDIDEWRIIHDGEPIITKETMSLRINALIEGKRLKANKKNELEFFTFTENGNIDHSCARVDAVLKCRQGARSHLEVCSVWNAWGPQSAVNIKSNPKVCSCSRCMTKDDLLGNINDINFSGNIQRKSHRS